jgi:hypothetical protein
MGRLENRTGAEPTIWETRWRGVVGEESRIPARFDSAPRVVRAAAVSAAIFLDFAPGHNCAPNRRFYFIRSFQILWEAFMSASLSQIVRHGLHSLTRKLAIEVLAVSLPIVVALMVPPTLAKPVAAAPQSSGGQLGLEGRPAADEENAKIKEFMMRVALSHAVSLRPAAPAATATAMHHGPTAVTSVPSLSRAAVAPGASGPGAPMAHIADSVLPAPRTTLETAEPVVDAAQARAKPQAEDIVSISDATRSIAKKL